MSNRGRLYSTQVLFLSLTGELNAEYEECADELALLRSKQICTCAIGCVRLYVCIYYLWSFAALGGETAHIQRTSVLSGVFEECQTGRRGVF